MIDTLKSHIVFRPDYIVQSKNGRPVLPDMTTYIHGHQGHLLTPNTVYYKESESSEGNKYTTIVTSKAPHWAEIRSDFYMDDLDDYLEAKQVNGTWRLLIPFSYLFCLYRKVGRSCYLEHSILGITFKPISRFKDNLYMPIFGNADMETICWGDINTVFNDKNLIQENSLLLNKFYASGFNGGFGWLMPKNLTFAKYAKYKTLKSLSKFKWQCNGTFSDILHTLSLNEY